MRINMKFVYNSRNSCLFGRKEKLEMFAILLLSVGYRVSACGQCHVERPCSKSSLPSACDILSVPFTLYGKSSFSYLGN